MNFTIRCAYVLVGSKDHALGLQLQGDNGRLLASWELSIMFEFFSMCFVVFAALLGRLGGLLSGRVVHLFEIPFFSPFRMCNPSISRRSQIVVRDLNISLI